MKVWTTKNGKVIRIEDMDNNHLLNTIKFLNRRIQEFKAIHYPCMRSEVAQEVAEKEYDRAMELFVKMVEMRNVMEEEMRRRE
ncbi:MAG: hypothetical protein DRP08_03950 [Candidatus Aenigmatarchaeota archaeon]|nr:MAG: hypothetical protein DRP08_03950 [Candidatus Aenigmarchaeota archaeon]